MHALPDLWPWSAPRNASAGYNGEGVVYGDIGCNEGSTIEHREGNTEKFVDINNTENGDLYRKVTNGAVSL